jgi:hypothetical protein
MPWMCGALYVKLGDGVIMGRGKLKCMEMVGVESEVMEEDGY